MVAEYTNKIRPLCLSFWTPPTVRPQAILIGKMIPEWIAQGVKPVIVTYEGNGHWDIDAPVYKIPQFKLNRILNRIPPVRSFARRRYQNDLVKRIVEITKKHNINVIFSFANPQESNIIGSIVKEKTGIPFISHFSDPWYDNPWSTLSFWRKRRVLAQETRIIKNSDAAIFINASLRDMVMNKYPEAWRQKGAVIHHCFSPADYPLSKEEAALEKSKWSKFVFSYVGAFYKGRNPEIVFQALQKNIDKDKNIKNKIEFQLVGCDSGYTDFTTKDIKILLEKYNLSDVVTFVPKVEYRESLKYMQLADCLVMIDVRDAQSWCFPSKIVDYAGSGSAILGVANGGPVAEFLEKLGYKNFTYGEADRLSAHLEELIAGRIRTKENTEFLNAFSVTSATKQLLGLFNKVSAGK
ncbi:MAG: hypothetical protein Q8P07_06380 [bacterium]|nr:hypothetical protein [bacterium]